MEEKNKYQLYLNIVPFTSDTMSTKGVTANTMNDEVELFFGVLNSDKVVRAYNDKDFFLNIPLYKTFKIEEYIDVKQQENIETVERQQFNPYFIELGFFDSVIRNKVNHGNELTLEQVNYIKSVRPDVANSNIRAWFETIGKAELPWFKGKQNEVTINDISEIQSNNPIRNNETIIGKAIRYPIEINS